MPKTTADGTTIYYETTGNPQQPTLLLVNGLGSQLSVWHADLLTMFANRGLHVVTYDNRDVGLSDGFDDASYDFSAGMNALRNREQVQSPYSLADMAADGMGVLDALNIEQAHVAGVSMGGMLVQTMAINHPDRLLSMTSIMSTTGDRDVGRATDEANKALLAPPAKNRDDAIAQGVASTRVFGSPAYFDEATAAENAAIAYDRAFRPSGVARQLLAIWADGSRSERLAKVSTPTLVIHGAVDPLIPPDGGVRTAEVIPDARLEVVDGMGHDYPRELWPTLVGLIADHAMSVPGDRSHE